MLGWCHEAISFLPREKLPHSFHGQFLQPNESEDRARKLLPLEARESAEDWFYSDPSL